MSRTVVHELKTWPEPFQAIVDGRKTFEIRQDDRGGFKVGDLLKLEEYVPPASANHDVGQYTGRWLFRTVSYIAKGWGLPDGMVVMALDVEKPAAADSASKTSGGFEPSSHSGANSDAGSDGQGVMLHTTPAGGPEEAGTIFDEDPGRCVTCGKPWELVRPGKSQPNCECSAEQAQAVVDEVMAENTPRATTKRQLVPRTAEALPYRKLQAIASHYQAARDHLVSEVEALRRIGQVLDSDPRADNPWKCECPPEGHMLGCEADNGALARLARKVTALETARTCSRKPNPHWKCYPECPNYRGPACPTCGTDNPPLPGTAEYHDYWRLVREKKASPVEPPRCLWSHRIGYDCELTDGHEGNHQATDLDGKAKVGWKPGRDGEYRRSPKVTDSVAFSEQRPETPEKK